ncbi:hypothetical protein DL96DRAFT_1248447 [Flagelloscypha sp. PMI_526]|nr:hypothetical protein DL96DRAFT_1248447 [Flagelloscypha sp. PMI_526]
MLCWYELKSSKSIFLCSSTNSASTKWTFPNVRKLTHSIQVMKNGAGCPLFATSLRMQMQRSKLSPQTVDQVFTLCSLQLKGYIRSGQSVHLMLALKNSLVLDPERKLNYIRKAWGDDLVYTVETYAEDIYKEYYARRYGPGHRAKQNEEAAQKRKGESARLGRLIRKMDSSSSSEDGATQNMDMDTSLYGPHYASFRAYLDAKSDKLNGKSLLE